MSEAHQPSFWSRYWEAARCVAGSGRELVRMSRDGVGSVVRLVRHVNAPNIREPVLSRDERAPQRREQVR